MSELYKCKLTRIGDDFKGGICVVTNNAIRIAYSDGRIFLIPFSIIESVQQKSFRDWFWPYPGFRHQVIIGRIKMENVYLTLQTKEESTELASIIREKLFEYSG
jgi:hypothetical protein